MASRQPPLIALFGLLFILLADASSPYHELPPVGAKDSEEYKALRGAFGESNIDKRSTLDHLSAHHHASHAEHVIGNGPLFLPDNFIPSPKHSAHHDLAQHIHEKSHMVPVHHPAPHHPTGHHVPHHEHRVEHARHLHQEHHVEHGRHHHHEHHEHHDHGHHSPHSLQSAHAHHAQHGGHAHHGHFPDHHGLLHDSHHVHHMASMHPPHKEANGYPMPLHGGTLEEIFGLHTKYGSPKPGYVAPKPKHEDAHFGVKHKYVGNSKFLGHPFSMEMVFGLPMHGYYAREYHKYGHRDYHDKPQYHAPKPVIHHDTVPTYHEPAHVVHKEPKEAYHAPVHGAHNAAPHHASVHHDVTPEYHAPPHPAPVKPHHPVVPEYHAPAHPKPHDPHHEVAPKYHEPAHPKPHHDHHPLAHHEEAPEYHAPAHPKPHAPEYHPPKHDSKPGYHLPQPKIKLDYHEPKKEGYHPPKPEPHHPKPDPHFKPLVNYREPITAAPVYHPPPLKPGYQQPPHHPYAPQYYSPEYYANRYRGVPYTVPHYQPTAKPPPVPYNNAPLLNYNPYYQPASAPHGILPSQAYAVPSPTYVPPVYDPHGKQLYTETPYYHHSNGLLTYHTPVQVPGHSGHIVKLGHPQGVVTPLPHQLPHIKRKKKASNSDAEITDIKEDEAKEELEESTDP